jgi:hypothetical protein
LYGNEWRGEFLGKEENQEEERDEECNDIWAGNAQSMVPFIKWKKKKNVGFYVVITWLEDGLGKLLRDCDVLFFFFKNNWFI